jgi:DUF2934 family protein
MAKRAPRSTSKRAVASMRAGAASAQESIERPNGQPTEEDVRIRAYHRYLERGAAHGNDIEDWVEAEKELKVGRQS